MALGFVDVITNLDFTSLDRYRKGYLKVSAYLVFLEVNFIVKLI